METEIINGHKAVVRHIFKKEELEVGSRWIAADGSKGGVVVIRDIVKTEELWWVKYGYHGSDTTYEKDHFSFQCRYCKIVE